MIFVHSCVRGRNPVHSPEEWRFQCIHVWGMILVHSCVNEGSWFRYFHVSRVGFRCIYLGATISVHACVRGRIPVHVFEGLWFRWIHVWEVRIRCIHGRIDDFMGGLMRIDVILPSTHECNEIIIPQVNAPESYPSHMNAPWSSLLK